MLRDGRDTKRLAFLIASYAKYLVTARTESGEAIDIFEPHVTAADSALLERIGGDSSPDALDGFLSLSAFDSLGLRDNADFLRQYRLFCRLSVAEGLEK